MLSVLRSQSNCQSRHISPARDADDAVVVGDDKTNSLWSAMTHRHTTENFLPKDESELQPAENHLRQNLIGCYFSF